MGRHADSRAPASEADIQRRLAEAQRCVRQLRSVLPEAAHRLADELVLAVASFADGAADHEVAVAAGMIFRRTEQLREESAAAASASAVLLRLARPAASQ